MEKNNINATRPRTTAIVCSLLLLGMMWWQCKKNKADVDAGNDTFTNPFSTQCDSATWSVWFDSVAYYPQAFYNTFTYDTTANGILQSLELKTYVNGGYLKLKINNWAWQSPPDSGLIIKRYSTLTADTNHACKTVQLTTQCDGAQASFISGATTYASSFSSYNGHVTITLCNTNLRRVSGTYDVQVLDNTNSNPHVIKGNFELQCYR